MLGAFGEKLSTVARDQLLKIGVDVQLNVKVVGVDATGVDVIDPDGSQRRIRSRTKVWAAGVSASPLGKLLAEQSEAEVDRAGRVQVNDDLSLPGHPEVFVIGDMMALDNLPGVAQVAMQGGKHAADQIKRRLRGEEAGQPFKYFDKGSMATISRGQAVAQRRQGQDHRVHRLDDVARRARRVPGRLQEPVHHDPALDGQLPAPRPLAADRDQAADRGPDPAGQAQRGRAGAGRGQGPRRSPATPCPSSSPKRTVEPAPSARTPWTFGAGPPRRKLRRDPPSVGSRVAW